MSRDWKTGDKVRCTCESNWPDRYGVMGEEYTLTSRDLGSWNTKEGISAQSQYFELVAESPVRTVTRLEIVPGVYGILNVGEVGTTGVRIPVAFDMDGHRFYSADELRSAAMVLSQLAEALDESKS